jgi:hypothetical protein
MYSLRSVDVMSCAKMMGAVYGSLGLIFLPLVALGGLGSLLLGQRSAALSGVLMLLFAVCLPIIYGLMGFLMGAFSAWIYNFAARRIGGIRMNLQAEDGISTQSNLGLL